MGTPAHKLSEPDKPDITTVIEHEGVILKQRGRDFWARCPLHNDKTPSFKVDPKRQTFYCFGCHKHGDVITFIRERYGLSFTEALGHLDIKRNRLEPAKIAEAKERKQLLDTFRAWEKDKRDELADILRIYRQAIISKEPPLTEPELEALAYLQGKVDHLEYFYDIFCDRDDSEKYELFKEELGYGK